MIIDAHSHVWPPAIAAKALTATQDVSFVGDGTVEGLRRAQVAAGVARSVCLAISPDPSRLDDANAFVGSLPRDHFIPFGTIHPDVSPAENLGSLERHGVAGVKVHPIFQRTPLDDPRYAEILEPLQGVMPVSIHIGAGAGADDTYANSRMLRDLHHALPELELIACHFGGYKDLDAALEHVAGLPIHLDTSWPPSLATTDGDTIRQLVELHGADRIVFASDWPATDPARELEVLRSLGLDQDDLELILGGNMARLLRL